MAIKEIIDGILPEVIALRHELHANPEIALKEKDTRERIRVFLGDNFRYMPPLMRTDLIAELPGREDGECIALRADMDALPMEEQTGLPWASCNSGRMHACGHDGHMAILAGTARLMAESGVLPRRTVRFVFQPGEEVVGAGRELAALGAYTGARSAYALHGWPGLPLGTIGLKEGPAFGASHNFKAVFQGQGAHGAYPEKGMNPLPAAARALSKLQELHQEVFKTHGEVVSPCALNGGSAANVIPDEAFLLGTVRYIQPERGELLEKFIRKIFSESVAGTSISLELKYDATYDIPVVNEASRCEIIRQAAMGSKNDSTVLRIIEEETVERASEDFAFALARVPGCLYKLGLGEVAPALHSAGFDFPDDAIASGILMMTRLAMGEGEG